MPTYEYACQKCGQNFDAYQSMRDEAYKICPKELCRQAKWGKGKVTRLLGTGAGLIFKGSGFYITDYRSNSYKEAAKKTPPRGARKGWGKWRGQAGGQTPPPRPRRSRNRKQKRTPARDQTRLYRLPARERAGANLLPQLRRAPGSQRAVVKEKIAAADTDAGTQKHLKKMFDSDAGAFGARSSCWGR